MPQLMLATEHVTAETEQGGTHFQTPSKLESGRVVIAFIEARNATTVSEGAAAVSSTQP